MAKEYSKFWGVCYQCMRGHYRMGCMGNGGGGGGWYTSMEVVYQYHQPGAGIEVHVA